MLQLFRIVHLQKYVNYYKKYSTDINNKFIRLTNKECIHNGYKYNEGLNVIDNINENENIGLYFCRMNDIAYWFQYGNKTMYYIWDVEIPYDAKTYEMKISLKTDKMIISNKRCIWDDYELCKMAIETHPLSNPSNIPFFIQYIKYEDLYEHSIRLNTGTLKYIPHDKITNELCEIAIKLNGCALEYVPLDKTTKELCKMAVIQNGCALKYVPLDKITNELCEIAIKDIYSLNYIPYKKMTKKLCKMAVMQNGRALQYIPKKKITKELCKIAILHKNGYAIKYVPHKKLTKELLKIAIKKNGNLLQYIPDNKKTKSICLMAVKNNSYNIRFVPHNILTLEMCKIALQDDDYIIKYIPEFMIEKIEKCKSLENLIYP